MSKGISQEEAAGLTLGLLKNTYVRLEAMGVVTLQLQTRILAKLQGDIPESLWGEIKAMVQVEEGRIREDLESSNPSLS